MLRNIRTILIIVFILVLIWTGFLIVFRFTHEDVKPPVITSDTRATAEDGLARDVLEISVSASKEELCQGLHAYDNMDGDITDRIMIRSISKLVNASDALVTYIVYDDASNYATYQRTVRYVDYTAPRFRMSSPMVFNVGADINFLDRISANDVIDGDISGRILLTKSTVVKNVPGSYFAEVAVTNSMGDTATLPMEVVIQAATTSAPTIRLKDYLIYVNAGTTPDFSLYLSSLKDPLDPEVFRTDLVTINSSRFSADEPGIYEVYYYYTGKSGETATAVLLVVVE